MRHPEPLEAGKNWARSSSTRDPPIPATPGRFYLGSVDSFGRNKFLWQEAAIGWAAAAVAIRSSTAEANRRLDTDLIKKNCAPECCVSGMRNVEDPQSIKSADSKFAISSAVSCRLSVISVMWCQVWELDNDRLEVVRLIVFGAILSGLGQDRD